MLMIGLKQAPLGPLHKARYLITYFFVKKKGATCYFLNILSLSLLTRCCCDVIMKHGRNMIFFSASVVFKCSFKKEQCAVKDIEAR